RRNVAAGRLRFTTDVDAGVRHGTLQFIAVGTPPGEDGSADMQHVIAAARGIGARMTEYKVIVDKSTVPVGTADRVRETVAAELGADIEHVRQGIGADPRIGYHFLYPGAGYGGSCFPKDVKALQFTAQQHGRPLTILAAVAEANEAQKLRLIEKITKRLGTDL